MIVARRPWRRRVLGCLLVVAVLAGLAATVGRRPMLTWIGSQLVHEDPPSVVDAAVVLSGGFPNRELEAAAVFASGGAPLIVLTRDPEPAGMAILRARGVLMPNAVERRISVLEQLGVPASRLVVTAGTIQSTADEAAAVASLASERQWRRVLVVTSPWHTARARLVFRAQLEPLGITVLTRGATDDHFDPATWYVSRAGLREGIFEWQKLLAYRWQY
ncbi:MAG: YdcF family protein [Acidimicrobiia bacterium]|nr:YdcF family protein [Acidimicrobiia bacterium]